MTARTVPPPPPSAPTGPGPRARMKPGHWLLLVAGVLLTVLGVGATIGGAVLLGAAAAQADGRYLTGKAEHYQSTGYALTTPSVVIDAQDTGLPGAPTVGDLASVQVRVSSVVSGQEIFIGLAETSRTSAYLEGVPQSSLGNISWSGMRQGPGRPSWTNNDVHGEADQLQTSAGDQVPAAPADQDFWAASATGTGTQEITFELQPGQWSLVVMNADATRPVWVELQPGARSDFLGPLGTPVLIVGLISLVIGVPLLLAGTAGLGRDITPTAPPRGRGPGAALAQNPGESRTGASGYPVRFLGFLDQRLSRGLWLVKWLLAIPHYLVLALLWVALIVTTIAAGLAILFTGRYPRSWFAFTVGVLRWNWRVGFYAYSALGTDRYPPFTLASTDYPADFDIAYPERLSRGLVLVKWWLLAIPHLLIVGVLTSGAGTWGNEWDESGQATTASWGPSLLGVLVLIAAVILLFTGRYRHELFNLIMGLNRWVYRVGAYVLLMRDEYPPFRLDQGPFDPTERGPARGGPWERDGTAPAEAPRQ